MFKTIKNAWKIPDLRKKILFTLLIIVVFRIGAAIPVPVPERGRADRRSMGSVTRHCGQRAGLFEHAVRRRFRKRDLVCHGLLRPYINSSIIMQLLTVAIPPLERMAKEGEEGRKKIGAITRYVTVVLGLIQGTAYYLLPAQQQLSGSADRHGYTAGAGEQRICRNRHHPGVYRWYRIDDVAGRADQPEGHWQRYFHSAVRRYRGETARTRSTFC